MFRGTLYVDAKEIKIARGSLLGAFVRCTAGPFVRYLNGYSYWSVNICPVP